MRSDPNHLVKLFSQLVISPDLRRAIESAIQVLPDHVREAFYQDMLAYDPGNNDWSSVDGKPGEQKPRYVLRSAADAMQPQAPVDWIIEGVFSRGSLSVVAGAPGTKKTYAMLSAGVCVALGKPWLNFSTRQAKVLIIDEESGERRIARRLAQTIKGEGGDANTSIQYISLPRFNFSIPSDCLELQRLIQMTGAEFVVIDALVDVMRGADENSVKDVLPVFLALRTITENCQCAIVLIHHTNKMGGYRGSSAISGAVDLLIIVESSSGSNEVKFRSEKTRDVEPFSFSANSLFEDDLFRMKNELSARNSIELTETEAIIYKCIEENDPITKKEIQDKCKPKLTEKITEKGIYSLIAKKRIMRTNPDESGRGVQAVFAIAQCSGHDTLVSTEKPMSIAP